MSLPKDFRRVHGVVDPWLDCQKAMNRLYYGDENITDGPGKTSIYRGVVVVGCILRADAVTGDPVAIAGGTFVYDPRDPGYAKVLAGQLRATADRLEKESGS